MSDANATPTYDPSDRFARAVTYQSAAYAAHDSDTVPMPVTLPNGSRSITVSTWGDAARLIVDTPRMLEPASGGTFPVGMFPDSMIGAATVHGSAIVTPRAVDCFDTCRAVADSYPLPSELEADRDGIASDAFCRIVADVLAGRDTFKGTNVGRAVDTAAQSVKRARGLCVLAWDDTARGEGVQSPDLHGQARHHETRRQAFARLALSDLASLARVDANVSAYLREVIGSPAVADDTCRDAMQAARVERRPVAAIIRRANREAHNAACEQTGRARAKVNRGKATRRERAAVAVADVLAGYGFAEPASGKRYAAGKGKRIARQVPAWDCIVYPNGYGPDGPTVRPSDVSPVLAVLAGGPRVIRR